MSEPRYPIRTMTMDELPACYELEAEAFNLPEPSEPAIERVRPLFEPKRSLAALDGDLHVGNAAVVSLRMSVPGGLLTPVAGITGIAVRQTYRRQGILRSLMTRQLTDLHDGGEPIAALYASESSIYGRFGYGHATTHAAMTLRTGENRLVPDAPADPALRLRSVSPADALPELAKVFDAALAERPGTPARDAAWWNIVVADPEYRRAGNTPLRCVIAEDSAGPRGYVLFAVRPGESEDGIADARLTVRELIATDPAAYSTVWGHVLDRDLVGTIVAENRPIDDPLLRLLADARRTRVRAFDGLWIRLVDVDRALAARRYAAPVDTVIEVDDPVCPWNAGTWRLTADSSDARCERTEQPADVSLPVTALGAAFLGGTRLMPFMAAGRASEHRPGALRALSTALSWDPAPWCPTDF